MTPGQAGRTIPIRVQYRASAMAYGAEPARRCMRILIVEDEPKLAAFVKRGLVAERYAVDTIPDGATGLEYVETYPYDLIILDLMLPAMSGEDLLQRIRRRNACVP